jgi:hypothetical protein
MTVYKSGTFLISASFDIESSASSIVAGRKVGIRGNATQINQSIQQIENQRCSIEIHTESKMHNAQTLSSMPFTDGGSEKGVAWREPVMEKALQDYIE